MKPFTCIYDLSHAPLSIGDVFMYLAGAWMKMRLNDRDCLDFALVFPRENEQQGPQIFRDLPRGERLAAARQLLDMTRLFRDVRNYSFSVDDGSTYDRFRDEFKCGGTYPPLDHYRAGTYMHYDVLNNVLPEYIETFGRPLDHMLDPRITTWAMKFLKANAGYYTRPITTNLRLNPRWGTHRNSDPCVWQEFFKRHRRWTFFLLCAEAEVELLPAFHGNVVVTKRLGTTAVQDFALAACSFANIGASSGVSMLPMFGSRPCFNAHGKTDHNAYPGATSDGERLRFPFNLDDQVYSLAPETVDMLSDFLGSIMPSGDDDYFDHDLNTNPASWLD